MSFTVQPHGKHMALLAAKGNVPAAPADKVPISYDRWEFPVLVRELSHERLPRRANALRTFCAELGTPKAVALASSVGAGPVLVSLLQDASAEVRRLVARALRALAQDRNGRAHLLSCRGFPAALLEALDDEDEQVCATLHDAALEAAGDVDGADALAGHGFVARLTERARQRHAAVQATSLHIILVLQQENVGATAAGEALRSGLVATAVSLCGSPHKAVRRYAAANIAACAVSAEGKAASEKEGAVGALCGLLTDHSTRVVSEATHALASVAVLDSVKHAAVERGALPLLIALLEHRSGDVRLHALKALSYLVAAPSGRKYLRESEAPRLTAEIARDTDPLLVDAASVLRELIERTP